MELHRPRVFEIRVFGDVFGPKRAEVAGEWSTSRDVELYDLWSSPDSRYLCVRNTTNRPSRGK